MSNDGAVHTLPVRDLIEHDTSDDCWCGPTCEPVPRDDGSMGWLYMHHSLDGREFREPNYTGPPIPVEARLRHD